MCSMIYANILKQFGDFFYSYCPTICPKVKNQMLRIHDKFQDDNKIQIFNSLGIQFLFSIEKAGGNVISQNVISSCQEHKKRRGILIIIIIIIIILFIIIIITTITVCFDNPGARTTRGKQTLCSSLKRTRRTPSFAKFQR